MIHFFKTFIESSKPTEQSKATEPKALDNRVSATAFEALSQEGSESSSQMFSKPQTTCANFCRAEERTQKPPVDELQLKILRNEITKVRNQIRELKLSIKHVQYSLDTTQNAKDKSTYEEKLKELCKRLENAENQLQEFKKMNPEEDDSLPGSSRLSEAKGSNSEINWSTDD